MVIGVVCLLIFIILFVVFLVLWLQARDKPKEINAEYLECKSNLATLQSKSASIEVTYRECESALDQLSSSLETNFEVDTTGMTSPFFIRDHTTTDKGQILTVCNYPSAVPRFVYDKDNFQPCGFAFKDENYPRCSTKSSSGAYGNCNSKFTDKKSLAFQSDINIYLPYDESNTKCVFWKFVNGVDPNLYIATLSYQIDSGVSQTVYVGSDPEVDSSYTRKTYGYDSCVPSNLLFKLTLEGVKGSTEEKYANDFTFVTPQQDFVISTWFNNDLKRPSASIGYVVGDTTS